MEKSISRPILYIGLASFGCYITGYYMSPEIMAYLIMLAVSYTGYDVPEKLPIIQYVPHSYFVQRACYNIDTLEDPCRVRAGYNYNTDGIIYMDEKFENQVDSFIKGIVFHEIIHYLQDMSGDWEDMNEWQIDIRCQEKSYRQREAYMMQDKYMAEIHNYRRLHPRRYVPCGET